jgi:hypothetical protein
MPLNKRTAENYTPLYLLASLGAGSMAVAVYLHLMAAYADMVKRQ